MRLRASMRTVATAGSEPNSVIPAGTKVPSDASSGRPSDTLAGDSPPFPGTGLTVPLREIAQPLPGLFQGRDPFTEGESNEGPI